MAMNDFARERELFKEIEIDGNLNEGDIQKAIERIDIEIKAEKDLQASDDLSTATNQNIHPSVAAKHARFAGLDITSGDQLKAAKPALKRMSKTFTDSNIPADVRAESLARDKEDVEQILLRSTTRDGVRGVEVTGAIPSESPLFARPDRGPVQFDEGRGEFKRPEDAPFFPEPDRPDTQDVDAFIRTLEPETSNEASQRNAIRISEFQAGRAEQFTLGLGQQRFETKEGETTRIAGVAPKTVTAKAESLSEFTAKLASSVRLKEGTPERQKSDKALLNLLEGRVKEGLLPGGQEIAKPVINQVQTEMINAKRQLEEIERIEKSGGIEAISGAWNRITIGASDWASFLAGMPISPARSRLDKDFNSMMRIMKIKFRKSQTGVAFNPIEAEEYNEIYPNLARDGEDVVKYKLAAIRQLSERVIRSGEKFLSKRSFLDAFAEEVEQARLEASSGVSAGTGDPITTTVDLSKFELGQ